MLARRKYYVVRRNRRGKYNRDGKNYNSSVNRNWAEIWIHNVEEKHDQGVKEIFGNNKYIDLSIGEILQKRKRIDWNYRRIGITYTLTRGLKNSVSKIQICHLKENCFSVHFE